MKTRKIFTVFGVTDLLGNQPLASYFDQLSAEEHKSNATEELALVKRCIPEAPTNAFEKEDFAWDIYISQIKSLEQQSPTGSLYTERFIVIESLLYYENNLFEEHEDE